MTRPAHAEVREPRPREPQTGCTAGAGWRRLRQAAGRLAVRFAQLLLLTALTADAEPSLRSASIRYGMTPAIPADAFAYLNFTVENPDPTVRDATVVIEPEGGGPVYAKTVRIGPQAVLEDRVQIVTSAVESYEAGIWYEGNRIAKDKVATRLETAGRLPFFLLNDDYDFSGASDLIRAKNVLRQVRMTSVRASSAPDTWSGFGEAAAVVLVSPKVMEMSQTQMQAVRDYVRRGGTLLWISPEAMLYAASTPWRDLLPVTPLRLRRVEDFGFMRSWRLPGTGAPDGMPDLQDPNGILFLESVAEGDGVTTLSMGEFPVCRWKRYGLGTIGCVAFDPCQKFSQRQGLFVPVWNHVLSWATRAPVGSAKGGEEGFNRLAGLRSGFLIPGVGLVQQIIFGYLAVVLLFLFLGFKARRESLAWVVSALASVGVTVAIFLEAQNLAVRRPAQELSSISVASWNEDQLLGEKLLFLFSKSDLRPSLTATDSLSTFYPLVTHSATGLGTREQWTNPLRNSRENGLSSVDKLSIQALKPRKLAMTLRASTVPLPPSPPRLTYGETGLKLETWAGPATPPATYAFLSFGNGLLPLQWQDGTLTGPTKPGSLMRLDSTELAAETFLRTMEMPRPCVVYISSVETQTPTQVHMQEGGFSEVEYRLTLLPLQQDVPAGVFALPPELARIEPGDSRSRLILRDGNWQDSHLRSESEFVLLQAVLPPALADARVLKATVQLQASNPGGNVLFDVALFDPREEARKGTTGMFMPPPHAVAPVRSSGELYEFDNLGQTTLLNPQTGRLGVMLVLKQKRLLTNPMDVERVNRWNVNRLRVSLVIDRTGCEARKY